MDPRFGTAVDQGPDRAVSLMRGRIKGVGIARVKVDVRDSGVGTLGEDLFPRLAAIGRLVESSLTVSTQNPPLRPGSSIVAYTTSGF